MIMSDDATYTGPSITRYKIIPIGINASNGVVDQMVAV